LPVQRAACYAPPVTWAAAIALVLLSSAGVHAVSAAEALRCGGALRRTLCAPGEVDEYFFSLASTSRVTLQVADAFGAIGLVRLRVLASNGEVLADSCRGRLEERLGRGDYRVLVSDCVGTAAGDYSILLLADSRGATPTELAVSPDGRTVYLLHGGPDALAVYNVDETPPRLIEHFPVGSSPVAIQLAADGQTAYVVGESVDGLQVVDLVRHRIASQVTLGFAPVDVAVETDGNSVIVPSCEGFCFHPPVDSDGALSRVDVSNARNGQISYTDLRGPPYGTIGIALRPGTSQVYTYAMGVDLVRVIDTTAMSYVATIPVAPHPEYAQDRRGRITASPDGRRVYVLDGAESLSVIDAESNTVVQQLPLATALGANPEERTRAFDLVVSPDSRTLYVSLDLPNTGLAFLWSVDTETYATRYVSVAGIGRHPRVALSPDGRTAYVTAALGRVGTLAVVDAASGIARSTISTDVPPAMSCAELANDRCENATTIDAPSFVTFLDAGSTTSSDFDPSDPAPMACAGGKPPRKNVWHSFTPPDDGIVSVDTFGSTYDTVLVAYEGPCSALREVACNDGHFDGADVDQSLAAFRVSRGTTYRFVTNSFHGEGGLLSFALTFQPNRAAPPDPPAACADAALRVGCAGDCDGNGAVDIGELVTATAAALDPRSPLPCAAADTDGDGRVDVANLVAAVDAALAGCR